MLHSVSAQLPFELSAAFQVCCIQRNNISDSIMSHQHAEIKFTVKGALQLGPHMNTCLTNQDLLDRYAQINFHLLSSLTVLHTGRILYFGQHGHKQKAGCVAK